MRLLSFVLVMLALPSCYKKEKPPFNETYSKFYGKWRSINLEHPIEFDFGPKVIYYSGYLDRNARLEIRNIRELAPQLRSLIFFTRYGNQQTVSISYNIPMDTISCEMELDYVYSQNAEYKQIKMVRK